MNHAEGKIQVVKLNGKKTRCNACGARLTEIGSFKYAGEGSDFNAPKYRLEKNVCNCGKEFYLRYDFIDRDGHINPAVFNGDINDPTYQWQSLLTEEQLRIVEAHLSSGCQVCMNRNNEIILEDAALGALIHNINSSNIEVLNG
jgi:hypothetical protein